MRITRKIGITLLLPILLFTTAAVSAKEALPLAEDPEVEKAVNAITAELRCLVCQNQTIADSHAGLAVDLKNQVREMVKSGKTEADIKDYMVKRYGDFVLYRPPVKPTTYALWVGPFVLLALGVLILVVNLKRRRKLVVDAPLSEEQNKELNALLKGGDDTAKKDSDEDKS